MFTGLIEAVCTVKSIRNSGGGAALAVDLSGLAGDCKIGDSIAINGVCLTISELDPVLKHGAKHVAGFDISTETLAKTTLGKLKPGSLVNVERAMKATDRFGGHFVQGHVDGTATVRSINKHGESVLRSSAATKDEFADIEFAAEPELLDLMVVKGSVAVDGISLTIASITSHGFSVALIPETLKKTTLGTAKIGDVVNIETDIIVKTIKKQLDKVMPREQTLTVEKLKQLGF